MKLSPLPEAQDPPQPDVQSQIVLFTESFPFTLTQQIHLTEFCVGVGARAVF